FHLAAGLELQLVAAPPLIDRPISAAFDELGRLYVTESSGTNDDVQTQLIDRPHRVVRLDDTDGDGRFDRRTVFAEDMMFPEGAMWFDGSLYVAAPPAIWKLTDTDNDGVADRREEWFDGETLTGCANDLHGPYAGPDGWIYWCKGAFAEQSHVREGDSPLVTRAAHIFRRRPDGGPIEVMMTGGMDNPVEVAFTPGGERIFTTTFLQHPGGGNRDGLIHAIYGGVYGKVHAVLDGHPRTGPVMPVLTHLGPAAPSGLTRLTSDQLGPEYRDNLLASLFNMHKITRHVLSPQGATFASEDEDFLLCDDLDFHPTDVLEDADGSVIVVDTGGWYKLCCPSSQLWKPDILGAIYRVRRTNGHKVDDPRGLELDWATRSPVQLTRLLDDSRPAVQQRAIERLAKKGAEAVPALQHVVEASSSETARRNAVWALTRIDGPTARSAIRLALADKNVGVRQAALHAVSLWRDCEAMPQLIELLGSESHHNRRTAAEALGRLGDAQAVDELFAAVNSENDRTLEHALIFAMIEIGSGDEVRPWLDNGTPDQRQAALITLDQMPNGQLSAEEVASLLASDSEGLRETAWWVVEHHKEWAGDLVGYFEQRLFADDIAPSELDSLPERIAQFADNSAMQTLLAKILTAEALDTRVKQVALNAIASSGIRGLPTAWQVALREVLNAPSTELVEASVNVINTTAGDNLNPDLKGCLRQIAADADLSPMVRLKALATVSLTEGLDAGTFGFLREHLAAEHPAAVRSLAVDALLRTKLSPEQLDELASATATVGPMELKRLLEVFEADRTSERGLKLVAALAQSPGIAAIEPDELEAWLAEFGESVAASAKDLLSQIRLATQEKRGKVEAVLSLMDEGDVRRGHRVFMSTQASCIACHEMGYLGGHIGPDLSRIGGIRSPRDLVEAILFPSVSFVRSYEPVIVETSDGLVFNGVVRDETDDEIVLVVDAQKTVPIR
ncbi:MAG: HEAT repeat domain-containing protein, partial [Pirellulales bacterium]